MNGDSLADHVPPQNLDAEQAVLGSMLIEAGAIDTASELLRADDFYRDAHRLLFETMVDLASQNVPVDLVALEEALARRNRLSQVGGLSYLMCLMEAPSTAANVAYYAQIVSEKSTLRRLIMAASEIHGMALSDYRDIPSLLDHAEQTLFAVGQRQQGAGFTPLRQLLDTEIDRIEDRAANPYAWAGLRTPFHEFNFMTGGLQAGDLDIIAARPSMGKTAWAMQVATHAVLSEGQTVAVFSLEMSSASLMSRLVSSESLVDATRIRNGTLHSEEWCRISNVAEKLKDGRLFIDDTSSLTAMEIRARCRRLKKEQKGLGLVVIDYIQLMRGHTKAENRNVEIAEIVRALKAMAKELAVPVLALAQVSRGCEQRVNKRPLLTDLRESGDIEAGADLVAFLYRDNYYKSGEDKAGALIETPLGAIEPAEILIAKQRNGPTGTAQTGFMAQFARFIDIEARYDHDR